ncbi:CheR family methyltransferase [Roseateles paludis]|jgi:chemotaxis protein methyltransferase CheR|uniref:protein-glutamate O-methyltransferase n=1 Tax=Roseateles paludis TaxID=3145238 RepID=A0ABV0G2I1_9BURK
MSKLSDAAFRSVCDYFWRVSGIRLTDAKRALVLSRLHRLALEHGHDDLDSFIERLTRGQLPKAAEVAVVDRLTTNETYFFREPAHFADLRERARKHSGPQGRKGDFRVWSAASSSGEEAYSAAMQLDDTLGDTPWRIHGTDLSTTVVAAARTGLYALDRAQSLSQDFLRRYCLRGEGPYEGQMLIDRKLRARVDFQCANLTQPLPDQLPMFDVIFLRNVLIYFEPAAKADIVRRVITKLKPDGVLYTGHAESLSGLGLPLAPVAPAIYRHE